MNKSIHALHLDGDIEPEIESETDGFVGGGGRIDRDRPLCGCWKLEQPPEGLPNPPRFSKHREAQLLILGEALVVSRTSPGRWVSYSRRKEFYATPARYRPEALTWTTVTYAVDALTDVGLLESQKSLSGQRGHQSTFRLRPGVAERMMAEGLKLIHCPAETVVLRDHDKSLSEYEDNDETRRMRTNLRIINEATYPSSIQFNSKTVGTADVLRIDEACIGPAHTDLHRVFNRGRFELGGRLYGGWWQSVPKERRCEITIGGKPTSEEDYSALHPTLLYAECAKSLVGGPYDLAGWDRNLVKQAFNIFLNAENSQSATWAIAKKLKGDDAVVYAGDREIADARRLLLEIKLKHGPIADHFCTGVGLRFQRVDSDMAERVLLEMIQRHGIVCLPIHDSFIVDATKLPVLQETMEMALEMTIRTLTTKAKTSTGYSKLVPQYGDRTPPRLVALSALPQRKYKPLPLPANDNSGLKSKTSKAA